jgi:hypothetical protein
MVYLARVISNVDPLKMGRLLVILNGVMSKAIWVSYASPYASPTGGGGFVAIPDINSSVLVAKVVDGEDPDNSIGEYVWFATLYDNNRVDLEDQIPKGEEVYGKEGIPHKLIWKSPGGNWIEISDPYPVVDADHEDLVRIQTSEGKRLILDSTLSKQKIVLADENGNGLQIEDEGGVAELKCNSVHITGKDQDIYINLNEGDGDISIIHNGNGNVNVESSSGNIELSAPRGSIKLNAPDVEISGDRIKIAATERVDFE